MARRTLQMRPSSPRLDYAGTKTGGCVDVRRSAVGRVEQMSGNLDKISGGDWGISDEWAIDPATVVAMVEHFRPFNDRLGEYLGRDLSAWNKV